MYLRNIFFILLAFFGPCVVVVGEEAQNFAGTRNTNPWIQNDKNNNYFPHPSAQNSPQYTSEYPSEYTPYYPAQYTPPYPTQGRPTQSPSWQSKPPLTIQNNPRPSTTKPPPPPPFQHQPQSHPVHHHNQISNPSIKPTPGHPSATTTTTTALDQYNHVYPDGSYEFRYELPDETARYEKGYFIHYHHKKSLVVRGYYSYRLPEKGYLTVFYTADHNGYRQDSYGITQIRPQLPRSLGERRLLEDEESINIESSINENKVQ